MIRKTIAELPYKNELVNTDLFLVGSQDGSLSCTMFLAMVSAMGKTIVPNLLAHPTFASSLTNQFLADSNFINGLTSILLNNPTFASSLVNSVIQNMTFTGSIAERTLTLTISIGNTTRQIMLELPVMSGGGGETIPHPIGNGVLFGNDFLVGNDGSTASIFSNFTVIGNNTRIGNDGSTVQYFGNSAILNNSTRIGN